MVRLGIVDDGNPNAFTFGHTPKDARVYLTRGLLERLDERELDAVVTHEVGFARGAADAVVFIDGGLVVESGPPSVVFDHPKHERTRSFLSKVL